MGYSGAAFFISIIEISSIVGAILKNNYKERGK
jgi:hypothetical protein